MAALPLFPLDLVLFPGTTLQLHIFEPRYRELIADCLEHGRDFGVVRAKDNAIAQVGCTANIVEVLRRYEDGRLDILTEGQRRFRILGTSHERSFYEAEVEWIEEEPSFSTPADRSRAIELQKQILVAMEAEADIPEADESPLSYLLLDPLPIDLDFKQGMLEATSENERLLTLISYYEELLPRVKLIVQARHKAGANGHIHH